MPKRNRRTVVVDDAIEEIILDRVVDELLLTEFLCLLEKRVESYKYIYFKD